MASARKLTSLAAALVAALGLVSACGSNSGLEASSDGGLPDVVKIADIQDLTGPASDAGTKADKGGDLAIEEVNDQHFLGDTQLKAEKMDAASTAATAASLLTGAVADTSYAAAFGPVLSPDALAMSPIAQKSKMPIIYTEASADGVIVGDYTFRASAAQTTFYYKSLEYLQQQGVKTLSVIYDGDVATNTEIGTKTIPSQASKYGFDVVSTNAIQTTTTDFSASISKAMADHPDAMAVIPYITQSSGIMVALRRAGFDGPVIGYVGSGNGSLAAAGDAGAGVTYTTGFSPLMSGKVSDAFIKAYQAKYGEVPSAYAAEGYDRVWMLARALKASGSAARDKVDSGLLDVCKQGFEGAQGAITFDGTEMLVAGVLVQWDGTKEILVSPPGS